MIRIKKFSSTTVVVLSLITLTTTLAQVEPAPPEARSIKEISSVLAKAPKIPEENLRSLRIVLLASEKDHGPHEHDYPLWQKNWALLLGGEQSGSDADQINMFGPPISIKTDQLKKGAPSVTIETAWEWPTSQQFENADLIVAFSVVNWSTARNAQLKKYLEGGGGLALIHMSCVVADGTNMEDEVVDLIGLSWHWDYTRWRHGPLNLDIAQTDDPICLGLPERIFFWDEAYWPLYGDRSKVSIIASSKETVGNFAVRKADGTVDFSNMNAIQQKWPEEPTKDEPIFWTFEYGKGRIFGSILGHYTWTFDDPFFRILMLRGMAWAAGESPYRFDPLALRGAKVK
ncbi:MAG: hypothetical protein HKN76_11720 [Saprospiraceae bacterium]|nr:hypothetical protein [Saprospiraceae bacterium]